MSDTEESTHLVRAIARESVALIDQNVSTAHGSSTATLLAGSALARLARLLDTQLNARVNDYELHALCARASIETWLTGHAALLLGEVGMQILDQRMADAQPSLEHIARLLDDAVYGESEQPKAFRRHLQGFFEEIDVAGSDGTMVWLARYVDGEASPRVRVSPAASVEHGLDLIPARACTVPARGASRTHSKTRQELSLCVPVWAWSTRCLRTVTFYPRSKRRVSFADATVRPAPCARSTAISTIATLVNVALPSRIGMSPRPVRI